MKALKYLLGIFLFFFISMVIGNKVFAHVLNPIISSITL